MSNKCSVIDPDVVTKAINSARLLISDLSEMSIMAAGTEMQDVVSELAYRAVSLERDLSHLDDWFKKMGLLLS